MRPPTGPDVELATGAVLGWGELGEVEGDRGRVRTTGPPQGSGKGLVPSAHVPMGTFAITCRGQEGLAAEGVASQVQGPRGRDPGAGEDLFPTWCNQSWDGEEEAPRSVVLNPGDSCPCSCPHPTRGHVAMSGPLFRCHTGAGTGG